jgi:hypothetical protein
MSRFVLLLALVAVSCATSSARVETWEQHCEPCGESGRPGVTILCCDVLARGVP